MLSVLVPGNKRNVGYHNAHFWTSSFSHLCVCIIDTKQHKRTKSATASNDEDIAQEGRPNSSFTTEIWIASYN